MKKLILFLGIIISTTLVNAQGNLQFNQVVSEVQTLSTTRTNSINGSAYTVPTGKVWKVVSVGFNANSCSYYAPHVCLLINGNKAYKAIHNEYRYDLGGTLNDSPIWLKAGDILNWNLTGSSSSSGTCPLNASIHFSIIEFNIIP